MSKDSLSYSLLMFTEAIFLATPIKLGLCKSAEIWLCISCVYTMHYVKLNASIIQLMHNYVNKIWVNITKY
jgi:hypothetical protein